MALVPYTLEQAEEDIAVLRGLIDILNEAHAVNDITAGQTPNTPTGGYTQFSSAGHQKYVSSDGSSYNTGRQTLINTVPQTINPAGVTPITGLTCLVAANTTYEFSGILRIKQGAANVNQNIGFTGPAATNVVWYFAPGIAGGGLVQGVAQGALAMVAVAPGAGPAEQMIWFWGSMTFTANGTFAAGAQAPTNAFTVQNGCILSIGPAT